MSRVIIPFLFFVCAFALPQEINKRNDDKIAFPDEIISSTNSPKVISEAEDPAVPKGNGTDLDNRFLGVGVGLGLALGQKLLGGHHGGYYPHYGHGGGHYPHQGHGGKFHLMFKAYVVQINIFKGYYPQPHYGGGFSGSQAQAQAQSQSFGGGILIINRKNC